MHHGPNSSAASDTAAGAAMRSPRGARPPELAISQSRRGSTPVAQMPAPDYAITLSRFRWEGMNLNKALLLLLFLGAAAFSIYRKNWSLGISSVIGAIGVLGYNEKKARLRTSVHLEGFYNSTTYTDIIISVISSDRVQAMISDSAAKAARTVIAETIEHKQLGGGSITLTPSPARAPALRLDDPRQPLATPPITPAAGAPTQSNHFFSSTLTPGTGNRHRRAASGAVSTGEPGSASFFR